MKYCMAKFRQPGQKYAMISFRAASLACDAIVEFKLNFLLQYSISILDPKLPITSESHFKTGG